MRALAERNTRVDVDKSILRRALCDCGICLAVGRIPALQVQRQEGRGAPARRFIVCLGHALRSD